MAPDSPGPNDLDVVSRALRELPTPRAPRTLLPRVMAAAAARSAAQRPHGTIEPQRPPATTWFMWPRAWQAASIAALALLVVGAVWVWPSARDVTGTSLPGAIGAAWTNVVVAIRSAGAAATVVSMVWNSFVGPIVPYVLVWIVVMSAACAGFGAALGRVALGGASHS
jgi:hypothetical protein